ncbi:hypothetical protein QYF36_022859 [Acer negundo]|nr:hypothetical protein QYF36_022859 [Acer negundo]
MKKGRKQFIRVPGYLSSEEENEKCDLVSMDLTRHQAKMGKRKSGHYASLALLELLRISRITRPPSPREEIGEQISLG